MQNIQAYAPENTQHTQAPPAVGTQNYHAYAPRPEITQQNSNQAHAPTTANITAYADPHASDSTQNSQNFVLPPAPAIGMQNSQSLATTTEMQQHVDANAPPFAIENRVPARVLQLQRQRFHNNHLLNNMLRSRTLKITMRRCVLQLTTYDFRPPQQLSCFLS